ncbi:MAG: creatininase family protein [Gammaproteobacteria bacterium]|nr:creatininase family protein [Gammaproteobacteria bacterium]
MKLHMMTWKEVESYLKHSKGIIIPIGSTEQHGPTGLIGTDCICPTVIAERVGEEDGILVGPTINLGMAQHHLAFPGTVSLRPGTLIALLQDYVNSLRLNGFRRFYFLNGHGGNINTVQAAFAEIYADHSFSSDTESPGIRCKLANWFAMPEVAKLARELYGDKEGHHATPSEIAVTQFAFTDHIKSAVLETLPPYRRFPTDATDFRQCFPDGRIRSDPSLARPEHGARFVDTCTAAVKKDYGDFLDTGL